MRLLVLFFFLVNAHCVLGADQDVIMFLTMVKEKDQRLKEALVPLSTLAGEGHEYLASVSPDGKSIACALRTDRRTKLMVVAVKGFMHYHEPTDGAAQNVRGKVTLFDEPLESDLCVNQIIWSPDSDMLLVGLSRDYTHYGSYFKFDPKSGQLLSEQESFDLLRRVPQAQLPEEMYHPDPRAEGYGQFVWSLGGKLFGCPAEAEQAGYTTEFGRFRVVEMRNSVRFFWSDMTRYTVLIEEPGSTVDKPEPLGHLGHVFREGGFVGTVSLNGLAIEGFLPVRLDGSLWLKSMCRCTVKAGNEYRTVTKAISIPLGKGLNVSALSLIDGNLMLTIGQGGFCEDVVLDVGKALDLAPTVEEWFGNDK